MPEHTIGTREEWQAARAELAKLIPGASAFAQQPFRLGYAEPEKEHTPRRRFEETLV